MMELRQLVQQTLSTSASPDPSVIADLVARAVPEEELRDALRQAVRPMIREMIGMTRVGTASQTPQPPATSRKVSAIREAWRAHLQDRCHTAGGWKFLADCTRDDLLFMAQERRDLAKRTAAWADTYEHWAALMVVHHAATFAQLPITVQRSLLDRAA